MLLLSVDQGQLLTGIVAQHGMSGLWFIWAGYLGGFVVPLVFAPLWYRLNLQTDNQFVLFRYPGKSGIALHRFRAIYVGLLVVSLVVCFHLIGFARVVQVFYHIDNLNSLLISGLIIILFALKNLLDIKFRLDVLHAFLFFFSICIIGYFVGNKILEGSSWLGYFEANPDKKNLIPNTNESWFMVLVYIGIQWWSCNLFDGGGAETSRFSAVKSPRDAIKAGLTPVVISFVLSFFMIGHILALLSFEGGKHGEISYVNSIFNLIPGFWRDVVFIGFFAMFITTTESLINWGASFLIVDTWKGWIRPNASEKEINFLSFFAMVFLCLCAIGIAINIENLQQLIKITFSISAGVAPVFILRWIWFRINAWSQLIAMLCSGVITLAYPMIHAFGPLNNYPMEESRIIAVTILTSLSWILVTLLSKNEPEEVKIKMLPIISSTSNLLSRLFFAFLLGILLVLSTVSIWYCLLK